MEEVCGAAAGARAGAGAGVGVGVGAAAATAATARITQPFLQKDAVTEGTLVLAAASTHFYNEMTQWMPMIDAKEVSDAAIARATRIIEIECPTTLQRIFSRARDTTSPSPSPSPSPSLSELQLAVVFNTEQMSRPGKLAEFARAWHSVQRAKPDHVQMEVWDYSAWNAAAIQRALGPTVTVRVKKTASDADVTSLRELLASSPKDFDYAVLGSSSPHRSAVIHEMRVRGKRVVEINRSVGRARDEQIARARVLLNVHFNADYQVFESVRCGRWLAAGMRVETEPCANDPEAVAHGAVVTNSDAVC